MINFSNINERILYLIESQYSNNQKKFAESIGFSAQVIFNIVSGRKSKPSYDVLEAIISTNDDINSEWLLVGKGEMLKGISVVHKADNEPVVYRELVESMKKTIALQDEKIARLEKELAELKYSLSNNPIVYSNVAEPPPELMKKELPNDSPLMQK